MSVEQHMHPYMDPHSVLSHQYRTDDSLVKTCSAGHMGVGLFAVRDMYAGTRILSEIPLITTPGNVAQKERTLAENVAAACEAVMRVNINIHHILLKLSRGVEVSPQTREAVRDYFKDKIPNDAWILSWSVESFSRIVSFYQRHAVGLDGRGARGFFYRHGVINHSCSPNAQACYDPVNERHQVQLIRDVKAGDQIFVSYIDGIEFPRDHRHTAILIKGHTFVCGCTLCTSQEAEAIMQRVPALYDGFRDSWERLQLGKNANLGFFPRKETVEVLTNMEELLSLLRHPSVNVVGRPLLRALDFCHFLHRKLGNIRVAAAYARERLAAHVRLYGFDAEDFLPRHDHTSPILRKLESELSSMETGTPWELL